MIFKLCRQRTGLIGFGIILLLFCGCAKKALESGFADEQSVMAREAPGRAKAFAGNLPAKPSATLAERIAPSGEPSRARMIHHDGFIHLRAPRPRALADEAARIVESRGGYVEQLDNQGAVFRVPVEAFQQVFRQLLGLGDVLEHLITTEDITDAFMDVDLRLTIARRTRQRLVALLAKAGNEKEKIRILREIQRVSIQIETLSAQRERLLTMARYSRITLRIQARRLSRSETRQERIAAFEWIHRLWPFADQVAHSGRPLEFETPEAMVALEKKGLWVVESADGAFFRASLHDIQPKGDTAFWLEAVRLRLASDYAGAAVLDVGNFKVLRLEDRSETPFIYLVGLRVNPRQALEVVEIYYPTPGHETRYKEAVFKAIGGGAR